MISDHEQPYLIERIVAALSYLTMGFVGFVWLIIGLFTGAKMRPFMQYHIYQSIFLSIAYFLLTMLVGFITNILSIIPLINKLVAQITFYVNMPLFFGFSLLQTIIYIILFYLAGTAFMCRYSYFPYVSEIINYNVRR